MNDLNKEKQFVRAMKSVLDEELEHMDGLTLTQLQAARRKALATTPPGFSTALWAGGLAAAILLLMVMGVWFLQAPSIPAMNYEDLEVLAAVDDPDFYNELEFYHWLSEMDRPS